MAERLKIPVISMTAFPPAVFERLVEVSPAVATTCARNPFCPPSLWVGKARPSSRMCTGTVADLVEKVDDPAVVDWVLDSRDRRVSVLKALLRKWRLTADQEMRLVSSGRLPPERLLHLPRPLVRPVVTAPVHVPAQRRLVERRLRLARTRPGETEEWLALALVDPDEAAALLVAASGSVGLCGEFLPLVFLVYPGIVREVHGRVRPEDRDAVVAAAAAVEDPEWVLANAGDGIRGRVVAILRRRPDWAQGGEGLVWNDAVFRFETNEAFALAVVHHPGEIPEGRAVWTFPVCGVALARSRWRAAARFDLSKIDGWLDDLDRAAAETAALSGPVLLERHRFRTPKAPRRDYPQHVIRTLRELTVREFAVVAWLAAQEEWPVTGEKTGQLLYEAFGDRPEPYLMFLRLLETAPDDVTISEVVSAAGKLTAGRGG